MNNIILVFIGVLIPLLINLFFILSTSRLAKTFPQEVQKNILWILWIYLANNIVISILDNFFQGNSAAHSISIFLSIMRPILFGLALYWLIPSAIHSIGNLSSTIYKAVKTIKCMSAVYVVSLFIMTFLGLYFSNQMKAKLEHSQMNPVLIVITISAIIGAISFIWVWVKVVSVRKRIQTPTMIA